jgi:hypothetical protein
LRNYPELKTELVDPLELGLGEARKIRKNISRSHRSSLLARAFMQNTEILGVARQVHERIGEEISLVRLYAKEDASHLPVLCGALRQMGLIRPSIMEAVEYTIEQFCSNMEFKEDTDNKKTKRQKILAMTAGKPQLT